MTQNPAVTCNLLASMKGTSPRFGDVFPFPSCRLIISTTHLPWPIAQSLKARTGETVMLRAEKFLVFFLVLDPNFLKDHWLQGET